MQTGNRAIGVPVKVGNITDTLGIDSTDDVVVNDQYTMIFGMPFNL